MSSTIHNSQKLWQEAFNSLPESVKEILNQANDRKLDKIHAALKVAEDKHQLSLKKRWKKKHPGGGEDIFVRDVMEKIVRWIRRFRDIGDIIIQYDPGHAALPWAAIRFLLQSAINDTDVHTAMVEDLEMVTRLMARYDQIEQRYLSQSAGLDDHLSNAIVSVYAAVLEFLGRAVKYFKESATDRIFKAPFRSINENSRDQILERDGELFKLASLADADRLVKIEAQVLRMADLSLVAQKQVDQKIYVDVLRWLSTVEYPRYHANNSTIRTMGTCQWLLQHPEFLSWESGSTCSLLLLYGIPGCGKTILSSAVIDRYEELRAKNLNSVPVAYFYCCDTRSEEERGTTSGLLRSLARQLVAFHSQGHSIHSAALSLYERLTDEAKAQGFSARTPSTAECIDLILAVVEDNPATIIIDAIDELKQPKEVISTLQTIMKKASNIVKVFTTSRDSAVMMAIVPAQHMIRITAETNKTDVRLVATDAISKAVSNCKLLTGKVGQPLKEKLIDVLSSSAGEMFLLVNFQLLRLSGFEHEEDVLSEMANLSDTTLDTLYKESYSIILKAGDTARNIAIRTFSWLLYAREELTISTLLTATEIKQTSTDRVLSICRGFVHLDSQSKVVRFVHHSVQQFLRLQQALQTNQAQGLLAMSCLSACKDPPGEDVTQLRPSDRFYDYAALYFGHHCHAAQSSRQNGRLVDELKDFLFCRDSPLSPARIWLDSIKAAYGSLPNDHPQKAAMELVSAESCASLFVFCTFGLLDVLKHHQWPPDFDWDQRNDYGHTALYAACFSGHTKVAAFLINQGASVNNVCGRFGSALHCAAIRGRLDIVNLLLDRGADPKVGGIFRSAIHAACRGNHEEVSLAIIEKNAILSAAEFDSILEAVLQAGFSQATAKLYTLAWSNAPTPNTATQAILCGQLGILQRLLRQSSAADLLPKGSVALAALHGHEEIIRFLLIDKKLDIEEARELGTPLRCAALNGHGNICRLLIDLGANINGNRRLGSALHAAAMKGQLQTVRLLIHLGADVNIGGGYYGTPLQAAACLGHGEIVQLLLSAKANPQKSGISLDAFHAAAENGRYHIIQILLRAGFKPPVPINWSARRAAQYSMSMFESQNLLRESSPGVKQKRIMSRYNVRIHPGNSGDHSNDEDKKSTNLTHHQSREGPKPYRPLRQVLNNANLNPPDRHSPLAAAADLGHLNTVSMILENHMAYGLSSHAVEKLLLIACRSGHEQIVENLLEWREDFHVSLGKALSEAASHGHVNVVETLLEYGGMASSEDFRVSVGKALSEAASRGHINVVETLLKYGGTASSNKEHFKVTLESAIRWHSNPLLFHRILSLANERFFKLEIADLLLACSSHALRADRADIVKVILVQVPDLQYKSLLKAFCQTLESGNAKTVAVIYGALQRRHFSPSRSQFRRIILLSAGNGLTDLTSSLLSHHNDLFGCDSQLLQKALNIAAQNGHHEICAYLLSMGGDPCPP